MTFVVVLSELERHGREMASKNVTSARAMDKAHPGLQDHAFMALAGTIERPQTSGIRVILFTPPYYEVYTANFTDQASDIIDQMHWMVNRLRRKYQVEYYDFSNDPKLIT